MGMKRCNFILNPKTSKVIIRIERSLLQCNRIVNLLKLHNKVLKIKNVLLKIKTIV